MARVRLNRAAPENHQRWLISYADFVTLLLAVFVVMFAASQPDKGKAKRVSHSVAEAMHGAKALHDMAAGKTPLAKPEIPAVSELLPSMQYLSQALAAEIDAGRIAVHLEARGLVISLRQAAFFPSGGDAITTSGLSSLEKISHTIGDLPNSVRFEGHTDSAPMHSRRFRSNWELSSARSIAMLKLFAGRFGIPSARFAVAGYAETQPVDSNDSTAGRAHNRRVDIVILSQPPSD
jgi:chemotaxis protein MotB